MTTVRAAPWLLAALSALIQAHGATTTGHLMWLAAAPWGAALLLVASPDESPRAATRRAFGLSAFIGLVSSAHLWGIAFFHAGVYIASLAYHALVWGAYGAVAVRVLANTGRLAPFCLGALWALFESVRAFGSFSFPFFFGGMLGDELWIAQAASVVGASGLSGLVFWVGLSLGGLLAAAFGDRRWVSPAVVAAPLLVVAATAAAGYHRVRTVPAAERTLTASAIQGSVPNWFYANAVGTGPFRRVIEEHYGVLYQKALRQRPAPDLIVFPETTFDWHLQQSTDAIRRIRTIGGTRLPPRTALLFGASFTGDDGIGSFNAVAVATADPKDRLPRLDGLLVKKQLVPLVEMGHTAADRWKLARFWDYEVGVMVCYESMYPQPALFAAGHGADLLVIVSDDSGLRHGLIAWTHAEQARFRAIEAGLPLLRAGQVGASYAVDAYGRTLAGLDWWTTGQLTSAVPMQNVPTVYRRLGVGGWAIVWALLSLGPSVLARRKA